MTHEIRDAQLVEARATNGRVGRCDQLLGVHVRDEDIRSPVDPTGFVSVPCQGFEMRRLLVMW